MQIYWKGHSCFQILANVEKGNQVKIVTDPFSQDIGLKLPKMEADILLISHGHSDHNNKKGILGNPFLVEGPGEYEVKGVYVEGIFSWHDQKEGKERGQNTIYTIEAEGIKICHLGDFGQKKLTDEQLERIGEVDVLMIPVGGIYTISAKEAIEVLTQIEPKITIPMHYSIPKLKIKLEGVEKFLKSLGIKKLEPIPKLVIKKRDLLPEEAKIFVLKP